MMGELFDEKINRFEFFQGSIGPADAEEMEEMIQILQIKTNQRAFVWASSNR